MKTTKAIFGIAQPLITLLSLLLMCSCATVQPPLPATVSMNQDAGRGGLLIVMVRVNDSKPLPFLMDTGSGMTLLDSSLKPKLGTRIGDASVANFGVLLSGSTYWPPSLYLGDTPLKTGIYVTALDFKRWFKDPHCPYMGILGIDVLKHYCVQLDFQSGQVRFLDAAHADKKDWGRPFRLTYTWSDCMTIDENLTGAKGPHTMLDTGDNWDGFLTPKSYQQWTNQAAPPASGEVHSPIGTLGGEMYHDLELAGLQKSQLDNHTRFNTIGLHVLSQNLVTFDFPERTLYLKRTSDSPLLDKKTEAMLQSMGNSAGEFSHNLRVNGQLPGWTKKDVPGDATAHSTHYDSGRDLVTIDEQKEGESSIYHYTFARTTQSSPWKLEKAWLTNQDDKTIKEFPVP